MTCRSLGAAIHFPVFSFYPMSQKRALVSVYNKNGVVEFCSKLYELGFEIVSTGGTHKQLSEAGIKVTQVSDVTQFPEILGGRVKTLHPAVREGNCGRRSSLTLNFERFSRACMTFSEILFWKILTVKFCHRDDLVSYPLFLRSSEKTG